MNLRQIWELLVFRLKNLRNGHPTTNSMHSLPHGYYFCRPHTAQPEENPLEVSLDAPRPVERPRYPVPTAEIVIATIADTPTSATKPRDKRQWQREYKALYPFVTYSINKNSMFLRTLLPCKQIYNLGFSWILQLPVREGSVNYQCSILVNELVALGNHDFYIHLWLWFPRPLWMALTVRQQWQ